jgi:aryl-alcohol dehydrogenase-like predicted oxidoreductase
MEYGSLPDVSGRVSRLVMGSMVFSTEKLGATFDLLDRFVEAGGTAVDEARVYAGGTSGRPTASGCASGTAAIEWW